MDTGNIFDWEGSEAVKFDPPQCFHPLTLGDAVSMGARNDETISFGLDIESMLRPLETMDISHD